jgi:HEPN domain-containing protein
LKAYCIFNKIAFPKTHNISYLIKLLEKNNIVIPGNIIKSKLLSDYSIETRYPGDYPEVDEKEYKRVVKIAEEVLDWVCRKIKLEL